MSIRKNLVYNFILTLSQVLLPLVSIPYVSRILSPEGIGKVSFIDSFTYYFIFIAEFGIIIYGIREVAKLRENKDARDKLVSELLTLHVLTSSVAIIVYGISVAILWQKFGDIRLLFFSLSYLLVNSFACEWYFMGMEKFRYITMRSLITRVLALASLFLLVKAPDDYYLYYAIMVVAAIVNLVWNNINLFREVKISFGEPGWKKHLRHTVVTNAINLAFGITLLLDNVLLRLVSSAAAVGLYAFSVKILRTTTLLLTDSLQVFFPRIVALKRSGNETGMQQVMQKNLQLLIFFAVPMCVGLGLLAGPLVRLFLGPQFDVAVRNVQILCVFPLLKSMSLFCCNQVLIAQHKERQALVSLLIGNGLFIPIALLLGWHWQDAGAAIALLIAELIVLIISYNYASKLIPVLQLFDFKGWMQASFTSLLFVPVVLVLQYLHASDTLMVLAGVPLCMAIYFGVQLLLLKNSFAIDLRQWAWSRVAGK
ncbi:oligosaccharide flippase family protein [Pseudoflavitalea sp. G-6-1-2]|uniref:oligosaccharide flippase family protein n=1 Tax=Pseudoflavitalea sp. G-6-1-2 TaxID=2728841 RepID=UPI00146C65F4|nr:oligosaccharide flippase family protein [Pseudoflavitalea sp. G-6-1-2]NML21466.1 oligosaccharide flippase family protein [Pseudoflavitalea sp. G-6-1-2]